MLKYWLYRLKWNLAPYISFKSPVHLDLELNNNCNQQCVSCWHSQKEKPFALTQMSPTTAISYLTEAARMGVMSVKFNLRGEPLLYPYLRQIVTLAHRLGFVDIMINTNGVLLNYNRVKKLNHLTTVIISVDSFDEKTYCKIHNCSPSDFRELIKNLKDLRLIRHKHQLNFKVKLNYHVSKLNEMQLQADKDFHQDNFPMFPLVVRHTQNREGAQVSTYEKGKRKKTCPHMSRRITITANGKFYPCCVCYNEPSDIQLLGSNLEQSWRVFGRVLKSWYSENVYEDTCLNCTSGDIYK